MPRAAATGKACSIARGALPFVPSEVALQSVLITDGTVSVDGPDQQELVRVGAVTGELSMASLDGPFRFKGTIGQGDARREFKVSTTAFESDGGLRLKAQLTGPAAASNYILDGRVTDLSGRPKLEGQISGQITIHAADIGRSATAPAPTYSAGAAKLPVDVRAILTADADGAKLADISLAFEHDGKPQLLAGAADVRWQGGLAVKSQFNSRWINVDQAFDVKDGAKPLDAMRRLAASLSHLVPQSGHSEATVSIDQVTLGGEALSDVQLRVVRADEALRLSELRVNLPGGSRLVMNGALPAPDAFDGEISLRGANLSRLLSWLGYGSTVGEARTEGNYSLKSRIAFDPSSIAVKDAFASLGSAVLAGSLGYRWSDRPRLDIVLEGDQIDLGLVSPRALDLAEYARALTGGGTADASSSTGKTATPTGFVIDPRSQDATLRIRANRLQDGTHQLRDVDVDAAIIGGKLALRRLRFVSGSGLELEAEGDIADVGERGRGSLRGTVAVADPSAVAELLALADLAATPAEGKRWRSLAPARLAWSVRFGDAKAANGSAAPATEVWLDGNMLGRRATAVVRIDGGLRQWRQSNLQLNASIDRPDWQRLRALVSIEDGPGASARPATVQSVSAGAHARLQLKLSGRPDQSLSAFLKLDDDAFDAGLAGRVTLGPDWISDGEGELQLRTIDLAQSSAVLGFATRNVPGIAVEGTADLAFKDKVLRITPSTLEVAGTPIGGEITITKTGDRDRQRIDGRITTARASIPRLLDLLVDAKGSATRDADGQIWQSAAFDLSLLDRIEGRLRVEAGELVLTPELALARAIVEADLAPGKVELVTLEGDALGARLSSQWRLQGAAAGASLTGSAKIAGVHLDRLAAAQGRAGQRLAGRATVTATLTGRGLTPRGLIAVLTGSGEIDIGGGQVGALSPGSLRSLSDEVLSGKREPTVEAMKQGVSAMLADLRPEARLGLGNRKLGFDVADGAAKIRAFTVDTAEGRAANRTTIDLARLMIDSEWKLEQRLEPWAAAVGGKKPAPLPPVTIVFVGPLAALGRLEPSISVEALVRELSVRRMERDVDQLERLRRLDEERGRAEAERQRADAAARAEAAARAAAAAAAASNVTQQPLPMPAPEAQPAMSPASAVPAAPMTVAPGSIPAEPQIVDPSLPGDQRRRPANVTSEPRQVPSSQRLKGSTVQDVFRRQNSGGN